MYGTVYFIGEVFEIPRTVVLGEILDQYLSYPMDHVLDKRPQLVE